MSLFPTEMQSDRLRYERLHPADTDPLELYAHVKRGAPDIEEITEHVTWDPYDTPKQAHDWIATCGEQFDAGESATYVIRPKSGERAGELAGLTGIQPDWDRRLATVGVWFRKPFWGRGYSGERAERLLELAFDRLDLEVVAVTHDPDNEQSERAISKYVERFGGRREGRIRNAELIGGEPRDSIRYSISVEEWNESREPENS